jgi:diguanylate cyclase (GGDEF)-like protein
MVACVGVADYLTGREIGLLLFYLAPIGLATWHVGRGEGFGIAAVSTAVSTAADALHELVEGPTVHPAFPTAVLLWNGAIQLGTFVALVLVLAALRTRLEGEELLARTDALTGIPNRRAFFEAAVLEIERARRGRRPLAVAMVDVDDFKDVNDREGHARGDALLVAVARTLRGATRSVDLVARLGGDEFALLLPEAPPSEIAPLLGRVRAALLERTAGLGFAVGFSIGAAVFADPPGSADEMTARADELMYAAKREAKGSIRVATFGGEPALASVAAGRR